MPSPSGPRSGKFGYVDTVGQVRNWRLTYNYAMDPRYHSASRYGAERYQGVQDFNGTFEGFGGNPGLFPGDTFNALLFAGPSTGVYGAVGPVWDANAIVDSLTINWNWQPSGSINWSIAFSANGCLTVPPSDSEYYDDLDLCNVSMCDISFTYADICAGDEYAGTGTSFSTWNNLESATLTITSQNQPYINSSTTCCTYRRPGNLDWTLAVIDQEQYPILTPNTSYGLHLYDTATTYWALYFALLQDVSDINVDIEGASIINKTNTLVMQGHICCPAGDTRITGQIINPSGTIEWPVALID